MVAGALQARGGAGEVLLLDLADTQQNTVVVGSISTAALSVQQAVRDAACGACIPASPLSASGDLRFASTLNLLSAQTSIAGLITAGRSIQFGPAATVVRLADQRDNSLGTGPEAIDADRLIVHAGSRLVTGGLRVYARSIEIAGEVDTMTNIVVLGGARPADLWIDSRVDDLDFVAFVGQYDLMDCADAAMPAGCQADLNSDGFVGDADFSSFAMAYDALLCP